MAPTPQPSMSREQQQALAKARARARVSAGGGMGPTNPMVAQGQAAQREYEAAGSPELPRSSTIRTTPTAQPSLRPNVDLRNINRAPQTMGPGYADTPGSDIGGADLQKAGRTIPQHVGNAAIGAAESVVNLPADLINSARQADAAFVPTTLDAARNANRMPQMAERVGKQPNALSSVPMVPTVQAPRIPIADEDQSVSGALLEGLVQYALVRKPLGMAAKGGGIGAQLGKDIATTGVAFQGNSGRVSDMIDPATIPEGPLRNLAAWLKTQPEDSPIMGRLKNMLEDATLSGPMVAPHVAVRGAQAVGNALNKAPVSPSVAAASPSPTAAAPAPAATVAPVATPSAPVAQPAIPQAPPGAAQAGPTGAGQQPSPGPAVAPAGVAGGQGGGVLNATPVAAPVGPVGYTVPMARNDAKIIGRLLREANVPGNSVKPLITDTVNAYQSFVTQAHQRGEQVRLTLSMFAEDYLGQRLPPDIAKDVTVKLRASANAANNSGDTAKAVVQRTAEELRGSQEQYLTNIFERELGDQSLLTTKGKIRGDKQLNAAAVYKTELVKGQEAIKAGKGTKAQSEGFDKLLGRMRQQEFFDKIPYELKVKAGNDPNVADLSEFVTDHPLEAAHWLQSELGVLSRKGGDNAGAYHQMRMALLRPLEDAVPGYRGARKRAGDLVGQEIAVNFGDDLFRAGRTDLQTQEMALDYKKLSASQKTVADRSIRDKLKNEFRHSREDSVDPITGMQIDSRGAKLTELQKAGTLEAIEQILGPRGKTIADGIRSIMRENPRIPAYGSDSAKNLAEAKAIGEAVKSPFNRAVSAAGDKTSFAWTIPADVTAMAMGAPPVFSLSKGVGMFVEGFGKPSAKEMGSVTKTLHGLPPPPPRGANALASPPSRPGRTPPPPRTGPRPPVTEADILALRQQYDALDHGKSPKKSEDLARRIVNAEKRLAAQQLPAPVKTKKVSAQPANALSTPPRPPVKAGSVNKNGFGGSSKPLPMDEASRMGRAKEQGFDVDTPLYHGTADDFEAFDAAHRGKVMKDGDAREAFFFSTNPKVASGYANEAAFSRNLDTRNADPAYKKARDEWRATLGKKNWLGKVSAEKSDEAYRNMSAVEKSIDMTEGAAVLPVYSRLRNPFVVDYIKEYDNTLFREAIDHAKEQGHDGVIFKNVRDEVGKGNAGPSDIYAVFNPESIRSINAKFDPAETGSSKLLASMGGAEGVGAGGGAIAGGVLAPDENGDGVVDAGERARGAVGGAVTGVIGAKAVRSLAGPPKAANALKPAQAGFGFGRKPPAPQPTALSVGAPVARKPKSFDVSRGVAGAVLGGALGSSTAEAQSPETAAAIKAADERIVQLEADTRIFEKGSAKEIQELLQRRGQNINADGVIGPQTAAAIEKDRNETRSELEKARESLKELQAQAAFEKTQPSAEAKILREAAPWLGAFAGLIIGGRSRVGGVKKAAVGARANVEKANALIGAGPVRSPASVHGRASNINDFWRTGGAGESVPFQANAKGEWRPRPKAMSPSKLYPEQSPRLRAEDYAWIASGLTEAGISTVGVDMATKEIAAAQAAVENDKSEANLERLEQAHNMLALAQAAQRFGLLVAGGRAIGAWKKPYQSSRPDIAAAEAERARILEHLSRVKQPKSPPR